GSGARGSCSESAAGAALAAGCVEERLATADIRRQRRTYEDDGRLSQAGRLDVVGDVRERAAQDQLGGLGGLRDDDHGALGAVVLGELGRELARPGDAKVQCQGGARRGERTELL